MNIMKNIFKNKKINISIILIEVIIFILCLGLIWHKYSNSGISESEREQIINKNIVPNKNWNIVSEIEIDGYIVSAINTSNNENGIAIFEPLKNGGYKFKHEIHTNDNKPIFWNVIINKNNYDLIWFNGKQTEYAEIIYTIDGQQQKPIRFNTEKLQIIYCKSPSKNYSAKVIYYDANGNTYSK